MQPILRIYSQLNGIVIKLRLVVYPQFVALFATMHDQCYNKILQTYGGKWSARAAQAVAKCRKKHGNVRKSDAGRSLKRWEAEKWVDKRTNKPCGSAGSSIEYCRPTKRISKRTPAMPRGKALKAAIRSKLATGHAKSIKRRR